MVDEAGTKTNSSQYLLSAALVSAVIVPQIGIGLSVPSLPSVAGSFDLSIESAQTTLIVYMAGYAVSVLLAGLMSDRIGPRNTQLLGLALATIAAIAAALAWDFMSFTVARFLQALGGCVGTVTTRLIVSKHYDVKDRMNILTTLASALAITPCIAPLIGGTLLPVIGWRGIFFVIALISALTLVFFLFASRSAKSYQPQITPVQDIAAIYLSNVMMPRFMLYAIALSLVWMAYFTFLSVSSGPLQVQFGMSPLAYGVVLGCSAGGYVAGSFTTRKMVRKWGIDHIIGVASQVGFSGGLLIVVGAFILPDYAAAMLLPVLIIFFAVGMTIPATQAGLLKYVTKNTGVTSGLFFFLQMISGALYSAFANIWPNMTLQGLVVFVAVPVLLFPVVFRAIMRNIKA